MIDVKQDPTLAAAYDAARALDGAGIGRLSERTLHSTLKFWLQPNAAFHEVVLDGAVADIFDGETVIEVQTVGLYPLKKKLPKLLAHHPVTVVMPLPHRKWVRWIDPATGESGEGRRSPKTGKAWDALSELFWLTACWQTPTAHPLTVWLLMVDMEEYRLQDGWGKDGKRGSHRADRIPLAVVDERILHGLGDVAALLPPLPETFTAAELARALGRRGRTLWRAVRCLEEAGAITRLPKEGRTVVYRK
ncbi:MAG: hypothetical protein E7552_03745 [Ruminococcaceae bacterium]|nr:hypothetical protein [Oscillospiraceae bacterium]